MDLKVWNRTKGLAPLANNSKINLTNQASDNSRQDAQIAEKKREKEAKIGAQKEAKEAKAQTKTKKNINGGKTKTRRRI